MSTSIPHEDNGINDNELVSRINAGEYELFHTLVCRYKPFIKFTANKLSFKAYDIEDLIQEGTIALFSAVKSYNDEKGNFSSFAARCIRNSMIDILRKASAKHNIPESLFSSIEDVELEDNNTPEKIFFDNENYRLLTDTIKIELSNTEYNVLTAYLSGLSYSDIADTLNLSVKSVDNSLKRVRNKLKNINRQ